MQCFHPLAKKKKIKCLHFRTGWGFFDKILFCQKMPAPNLFAALPGSLSGGSSVFPGGISGKVDVLDWKFEFLPWAVSLCCVCSHCIKCIYEEEQGFRSCHPRGEHFGHGAEVPYSCSLLCCSVALLFLGCHKENCSFFQFYPSL